MTTPEEIIKNLANMKGGDSYSLSEIDPFYNELLNIAKQNEKDQQEEQSNTFSHIDKEVQKAQAEQQARQAKLESEQQAQATLEHLTELLGSYASGAKLEITTDPETGHSQVVAHGHLHLRGLTSAEGLKLPDIIGGNLYLRRLTSAEGLKLPDSIGRGLYLSGLTSAEGLELPDNIDGDLWLDGLTPEARQDLRQSRPDLKYKIIPNP